jgi:endonuclease YncB( thermonuclease family)
MRVRHASIAALTILVTAAFIAMGGQALLRKQGGDIGEQPVVAAVPDEPATSGIATPKPPADDFAASRAIDPGIVSSPHVEAGQLERIEPRAPLSKLALATPPKPKTPDEWQGTPLFQPVATAAGLIQAKGYSIVIAGINGVGNDETCDDNGKSWACGIRARTAFRAFLRGRAVVCTVQPQTGRDLVAARCRIGKQDIGEWLVENGWARAAAGGPYAEAQKNAQKNRKGIFGPAPDLTDLPPAPAPVEAAPEGQGSILDLSGEAPPPATPPTAQPAPFQ